MPTDRSLLIDSLHGDLRAALVVKFFQVPTNIMAAMLACELTSVIASQADSEARAIAAIRKFADHMVEQVKTYGVGEAHPVATRLAVD